VIIELKRSPQSSRSSAQLLNYLLETACPSVCRSISMRALARIERLAQARPCARPLAPFADKCFAQLAPHPSPGATKPAAHGERASQVG
jgi:hypothetical protein